MKISEIMTITGLTKKAINYYEEEGLISPDINPDNGYREYTQGDIDRLVQISVLRQLDVPLKDIKAIISDTGNLKKTLKQHLGRLDEEVLRIEKSRNVLRACLENLDSDMDGLDRLTRQLSVLNMSLEKDGRIREGFMKKQLKRIFPGNFGKMLVAHFSPFLNESIDTPEKEIAWSGIVRFLDEVGSMHYPQEMVEIYQCLTEEDMERYEELNEQTVRKWLTMTDKEMEEEREKLFKNIGRINGSDEMRLQNKKVSGLSGGLKTLMNSIGYYDRFVGNLKILSNDYNAYMSKMEHFYSTLDIKMSDDGRIISAQ